MSTPRRVQLSAMTVCPEIEGESHIRHVDLVVRHVAGCDWVRLTLTLPCEIPAGRDALYRSLVQRRTLRAGPAGLIATWMPRRYPRLLP